MNDNSSSFSCFDNVSDSSLSEIWIIPKYPDYDARIGGYVISAVATLLVFISVPWNLLLIYIIFKKRLYNQPTILLLLNLILSNILLALLLMPLTIITGIKEEYSFGRSDLVRCRVCQTGTLLILLPWVSVHAQCLMAVDRFIYLKFPLKYPKIVTRSRTLIASITVWIISIALSLPPLFGLGKVHFSFAIATCALLLDSGSTSVAPNYVYALLLMAEVIVPVITLIVLSTWIFYIIRGSLVRKLKRLSGSSPKSDTRISKEYTKSQIHLVFLFGALLIARVFTWLPLGILVVFGAVLGSDNIHPVGITITFLTVLSEVVIHPVIEVILVRDIRMTFRNAVSYCKKKINSSGSSSDIELNV